jgi:hypothetical protein
MCIEGSGGKPPFPTCEALTLERFKPGCLSGREEGLAPADMDIFNLISFYNLI